MLSNPNDVNRLVDSANLLTMIFSTGQPMPVTHLGINQNNYSVIFLFLVPNF